MSNGPIDDWPKVIRGRIDLFNLFLKKENEAQSLNIGADSKKLQQFMSDYADDLHTMMLNDELESWWLV